VSFMPAKRPMYKHKQPLCIFFLPASCVPYQHPHVGAGVAVCAVHTSPVHVGSTMIAVADGGQISGKDGPLLGNKSVACAQKEIGVGVEACLNS